MEIEFSDDGIPFDSTMTTVGDREFEELRNGGMGLTLVRKMTKKLIYVRDKDRNVLYATVERKRKQT